MTNPNLPPDTLDKRRLLSALRAFRKGDFSVRLPMDFTGIDGEIAQAFNDVVEMNELKAQEFARIRKVVGKDGRIGERISLPSASGSWAQSVASVNELIGDLVRPTSEMARVIESVARGDLSQNVRLDMNGGPLCGEFLRIGKIVNTMVDQLAGVASEVSRVAREVGTEGKLGGQAKVPGAAGLWRDLTDNVNQLAANLTAQVRAIAEVSTAVTRGDLTRSIKVEAMGEVAALKDNINEMIRNLKDTTLKNTEQDWLKTNLAKFTRMLQGHGDLEAVSKLVLSQLAPLVNAHQGLFYAHIGRGADQCLELLANYASRPGKNLPKLLQMGEGLVGQCAQDKRRIVLEEVPHDYIRIHSGLGSAVPVNVIILPVLFEGELKGVIELGSAKKFSEAHLSFLDQLMEVIGIVFHTIEANMRTEDLLEQSQSLTRELQSQQEELKQTNDRLKQQAENMQYTERILKQQQEELQNTNEQLQEKATLLSEQMKKVEYKNNEVEQAKKALEEKAEQLALSSRYKSEFLANMSHELRTPLNSLLILARLLSDNSSSNLSPKQIEYAHTIQAAGRDLLSLINDILDLAKIESGTITLNIAEERFSDLQDYVERTFRQVAQDTGVSFAIGIDAGLPEAMHTDSKRLQQVVKNLLSNAFKFTDNGSVTLRVGPATSGWSANQERLAQASKVVAFAVTDTGIGIPPNKHKIIFEAFQQADGTTSRQYGGTGLGLSISRELARLLGGEITVESAPGKGSTFTLFVPLGQETGEKDEPVAVAPLSANTPGQSNGPEKPGNGPEELAKGRNRDSGLPPRMQAHTADDRADIRPGDRVVVIIEDDSRFAQVLLDLSRECGYRGVVAHDANSGLALVREFLPAAITLDLKLPDMDGWAILDLLKHDPVTRHIPVSVISSDDNAHKCLHMGAFGIVQKPAARETVRDALMKTTQLIEREVKTLMIVDSDQAQRTGVCEDLGTASLDIKVFSSGKAALDALSKNRFDCLVLGPALSDMPVLDLIKNIVECETAADTPIVMYGADGLTRSQQDDLSRLAEIAILKCPGNKADLLKETTMFLHLAINNLPSRKVELLEVLRKVNRNLDRRKVLIVDDDIRNIFALTGALEQNGLIVCHAENGKEGLEMLQNTPDIDIVLMDIMMPELDGYDTVRLMRRVERFKELPIIAVTAKAMVGDREKCLQAGASDYIAKPVDIDQLMALLRLWLGSERGNHPKMVAAHA